MFHLRSFCKGVAITVCCSLIGVFAIGCGHSIGPQRMAISGEVLFGDEPLESGRIHFIPIEENSGPAAVAVVTDGVYEFDRDSGPVIGKNKVQIESLVDPGFELDDEEAYADAIRSRNGKPVLQREVIPPEYNERSTLFATISPEGESEFDFELKRPAIRGGR